MKQCGKACDGGMIGKVAWGGLLVGIGAITSLILAGVGVRSGWWHFSTGLRIAEWAVYGAALGLALSLAGVFFSCPKGRAAVRGLLVGVLGIAATLPIVIMAIQWEYAGRTYPPINDITTDIEDPPVFWDMPNPTDHPGAETATLQRAAYGDLAPLALTVEPRIAFANALAVARDSNWEIVASDPEEGRFEATVTSFLFGFVDEVVVRISKTDVGSRVDVRSRSRLGRIDRGVNAKRIRGFLDELAHRTTGG